MALSADQRAAFKNLWDTLKADGANHGVGFFLALFNAHPEYQDVFPKLKGKDAGTLKGDADMASQAADVVGVLDKAISFAAAGDNASIRAGMAKLASTHVPRGITLAHFQSAFDVLGKYACGVLGAKVDDGMKGGWKAGTTAVMAILTEEYKKAGGN